MKLALLTALLVSLATACGAAGSSVSGGNADVTSDAAIGSADGGAAEPSLTTLPTYDDLPECDREQPTLACVRKLFAPLHGATAWSFGADRVGAALGEGAFAVASGYDVTAHHVLEANLSVGVYGCFFDAYRYATEVASPLNGPGCDTFLVAGGHPHAVECQQKGTMMANCVDEVPLAELFDFVLQPSVVRDGALAIAAQPKVGDPVFAVGSPGFPWLSDAERAELSPLYPLVSFGRVVHVDGRGVVASTTVYGGSSGGPLVNARGEAIGVLVTKVGHQRARGNNTIPASLRDEYAVAVLPDDATQALVAAAR